MVATKTQLVQHQQVLERCLLLENQEFLKKSEAQEAKKVETAKVVELESELVKAKTSVGRTPTARIGYTI